MESIDRYKNRPEGIESSQLFALKIPYQTVTSSVRTDPHVQFAETDLGRDLPQATILNVPEYQNPKILLRDRRA